MLICFPTNNGIGEIRGDQMLARQCFHAAIKIPKLVEGSSIDELDMRDDAITGREEPAK